MSDPKLFKDTNRIPKDAVELTNVFLHTFILRCVEEIGNGDNSVKILFVQSNTFFLKSDKTQKIMDGIDYVKTAPDERDLTKKYDLVIEDPFLGHSRCFSNYYETNDIINDKKKGEILNLAESISEDGFVIYFFLESFVRKDLHETLKEKGFTVCAIINFPKRSWRESLWEEDAIDYDLVLVIIKKNKVSEMVIAELDFNWCEPHGLFDIMESIFQNIWINNLKPFEIKVLNDDYEENKDLYEQYAEEKDTSFKSLSNGIVVSKSKFKGFENFLIKKHLSKLSSDFLTFKTIKFKEVILEIQIGLFHREFEEYKNAVYIRLSLEGTATTKIKLTEGNAHKYAQVLVNEKQISPEYLCAFLNSAVGVLIYNLAYPKGIKQQRNIANILPEYEEFKKKFIEELDISIPKIDEQLKVSSRFTKLQTIQDQTDQLKYNLLLNPISSKEDLEKLDQILEVMGALSEQDMIRNLIKFGENHIVEFKQTLSMDIGSQKKEKWIETSIKKTIAGFLNSGGGTLLIGIDDSKKIYGINTELKKLFKENEDKFLLHLRNMIDTSIGADKYPLISQTIHEIDGKSICKITCKKTKNPVFCEGVFYVRTTPATKVLVGEEMINYIRNHFGSL